MSLQQLVSLLVKSNSFWQSFHHILNINIFFSNKASILDYRYPDRMHLKTYFHAPQATTNESDVISFTFCLEQGSQSFSIHVPPNQNCTPLHTPKWELYPLCVPPNQKVYPYKSKTIDFYSFELFLHVCVPPVNYLRTPGVRIPQVENCWSRAF